MGKTQNRIQSAVAALVLLLACTGLQAQQEPMYTQYFYNRLVLNPAYAGSRDGLSLVALVRQQWVGFAGAPSTQTFSAHAPLGKSNSGVGLNLIHDKIGITNQFVLNGAYSFRIPIGDYNSLNLGLQGQVRQRQMDWSESNPQHVNDNNFNYTGRNIFLPNFGAGLYYEHVKGHYFGVSMPQMLENDLNYVSGSPNQDLAQLRRHYFVMGGLLIDPGGDVKFQPSVLAKYVAHAPFQVDINLGVIIKDRLTVGGTYRSGDSNDLFIQYEIKRKFRFGYAYDFAFTKLLPYNVGSHELMLSMDIDLGLRGFDNPRY